MARCGFKTDIKYRDENTGEYIPYICPEPEENILDSGLCIFHDKNYLKDSKNKEVHEQNIKKKLTEKIEKSEPLICIGYYLPGLSFEQLHFNEPINFSGIVFIGRVNFSSTEFTEANFSDAQFTEEANFSRAQFTKEANFYGAKFTKKAEFGGAQFSEAAIFIRAQFMDADFSGAQFTGMAIYSGAQFKEAANFSKVQFAKSVDFIESQFAKSVDFSESQFAKSVDFGESGIVDFGGAQFMDADFSAAQFSGLVRFFEAQFMDADFIAAQFRKPASFVRAKFMKEAHFNGAQFSLAAFIEAQFMDADFSGTDFTKDTDFVRAKFMKEAHFNGAQFGGRSNFNEIKFMNGTEFTDSKFIHEATFVKTIFASHSRFNDVLFRDPENIIFRTDNLSQVSFMNTDITRVRFGENVKWGSANEKKHRDEFKIIEESEIEASFVNNDTVQNILLGSVLAVYRNLRENYEYRMRYDEAGYFFIREMEMKRKYEIISSYSWKNIFRLKWKINTIRSKQQAKIFEIAQNNWISRNFSLIGLYYHLSRYGQSFSRPTLFGIGIILLSTLLWLTQPNPATDFSVHNMTIPQIVAIPEMDNKTNIEIAFERGLTNFLPSLSFGTELNVGLLDVAFKIVGGAVTFGLIIIALRRKFERKFRH